MQNIRYKNNSIRNIVLIFCVIFFSFILFITTDMGEGSVSDTELKIKSIILLWVYIFYIVMWLSITHKPCSVFFILLIYSMLSNAGQLLVFALGIDFEQTVNVLYLTRQYLTKAIDFQMLSTAMFFFFGILAWNIHKPKDTEEQLPISYIDDTISDILYVIASLLFIGDNLMRLTSRVSMSYGDAFEVDESGSFTLIIKVFFYIMLFVSLYKHKEPKDRFKKFIWITVIVAGITAVLYGSRNVLIPLIFGVLFVMEDEMPKIKKSTKVWLFIGCVLAIMFMNAFTYLRNISLDELDFQTIIDSIFGENPFKQLISLITEMGGTTRVLTYTISAVDSGSVMSEQTFMYTALKGFLPSTSILSLLNITEPQNWSLSGWITNTYGGEGGGWGYSMMAEAYFNFAELGFIFFAFFGYIFEMTECLVRKLFIKGRIVIASAWLYVLLYAIFLARAESKLMTLYIRYAIYVTIGAPILKAFFKNKRIVLKKKY